MSALLSHAPSDGASAPAARGPSFVIGAGAEAFAAIASPDVNLAIWDRPVDAEVQAWLAEALPTFPSFEERLRLVDGVPDAGPMVAGLPQGPLRDRLAADLTHLARLLVGALPPGPALTIVASFGPVRDDLCRKFHVDWVALRLLTTWIGPGTEWLADADVDRSRLGPSAACPTEANRAVLRSPLAMRSARPGQVLLMKGEAWPGNAGRGLVHRSPPITPGDGSEAPPRLLLTITARAAEASVRQSRAVKRIIAPG